LLRHQCKIKIPKDGENDHKIIYYCKSTCLVADTVFKKRQFYRLVRPTFGQQLIIKNPTPSVDAYTAGMGSTVLEDWPRPRGHFEDKIIFSGLGLGLDLDHVVLEHIPGILPNFTPIRFETTQPWACFEEHLLKKNKRTRTRRRITRTS